MTLKLSQTYVCWDDILHINNHNAICVYATDTGSAWPSCLLQPNYGSPLKDNFSSLFFIALICSTVHVVAIFKVLAIGSSIMKLSTTLSNRVEVEITPGCNFNNSVCQTMVWIHLIPSFFCLISMIMESLKLI